MPGLDSKMHGRHPMGVLLGFRVGLGLQQRAADRGVPCEGRAMQGGEEALARVVDVGLAVQEELTNLSMPVLRGRHQRSALLRRLPLVHICLPVQQGHRRVHGPDLGGDRQRGVPGVLGVLGERPHRAPGLDHERHPPRHVPRRGVVQHPQPRPRLLQIRLVPHQGLHHRLKLRGGLGRLRVRVHGEPHQGRARGVCGAGVAGGHAVGLEEHLQHRRAAVPDGGGGEGHFGGVVRAGRDFGDRSFVAHLAFIRELEVTLEQSHLHMPAQDRVHDLGLRPLSHRMLRRLHLRLLLRRRVRVGQHPGQQVLVAPAGRRRGHRTVRGARGLQEHLTAGLAARPGGLAERGQSGTCLRLQQQLHSLRLRLPCCHSQHHPALRQLQVRVRPQVQRIPARLQIPALRRVPQPANKLLVPGPDRRHGRRPPVLRRDVLRHRPVPGLAVHPGAVVEERPQHLVRPLSGGEVDGGEAFVVAGVLRVGLVLQQDAGGAALSGGAGRVQRGGSRGDAGVHGGVGTQQNLADLHVPLLRGLDQRSPRLPVLPQVLLLHRGLRLQQHLAHLLRPGRRRHGQGRLAIRPVRLRVHPPSYRQQLHAIRRPRVHRPVQGGLAAKHRGGVGFEAQHGGHHWGSGGLGRGDCEEQATAAAGDHGVLGWGQRGVHGDVHVGDQYRDDLSKVLQDCGSQ
mmetsp:Transcript_77758/g.207724  ORF Transcript_77758/g.207724 Transcript_77758/m.207724 type:complete len:679 (-) Transcript_77758:1488-3524(-)